MRGASCPKCQASMAAGFVRDTDEGRHNVTTWVAGGPVKSFWTGLKLRGRQQLAIATWRCARCGYLESYAPAG